MKGYDAYQQKAEIARKGGLEGAVTASCRPRAGARPKDPARARGSAGRFIGDFELNVAFRFGGTPYDVSERGLKLFAKEVLPVVKSWKSAASAKAPSVKAAE